MVSVAAAFVQGAERGQEELQVSKETEEGGSSGRHSGSTLPGTPKGGDQETWTEVVNGRRKGKRQENEVQEGNHGHHV